MPAIVCESVRPKDQTLLTGENRRRTCSLRVRWLGLTVFVEKSIEPVKLPIQTLNQVPGFAGPGEVVIFAREENDFGGDAEVFERAKPLFALLDRHAIVII